MKSDLSLGEKQQKIEKFYKKRALKQNSIFFIVNLPMRPELVFFLSPLFYKEHNIGSFFGVKFKVEILFL